MQRLASLSMILTLFGSAAEVVTFNDSWGENPLFNVISKSPTSIEIVFSMHEMVVEEMIIDGTEMMVYGVPGIFLPNDESAPNLSGTGRYIAIPRGGQAQVTILESRTEVYHNIEVAPSPNIPLESDDSPLRYEKDMQIYGFDAYYPQEPVILSEPRKIRGVDIVILGITPFQYNPVTKDLIVYKDIRVRVDFIGGNGHFGEDRLRSRFWEPILQQHLLNYSSLPEIDFFAPERTMGIDYIIIVPNNPLFRPWADTIKAWRTLQGINTEVYSLWEIGGSSWHDIEDFLNDAYNNWDPAPSAFLLLADYPISGLISPVQLKDHVIGGGPIIGGWNGITSPKWNNKCVSDNIYADVNGDDLPDMYHARICAENSIQLKLMVKKILDYEREPYTASNFYDEPLIACGWQDDRWFQLCSEVIRGFFINAFGKNPARQYALCYPSPANPYPGCPWSTNPNTPAVVQYWHDVGWLSDTLNPHDIDWWSNGSASGINQAINSGAFLVQHRDHGSETSWGHPSYTKWDLNFLFNTKYPFVYSINCLTGKYNWGLECFVEKFHRKIFGALGVNAASEGSYSFVNDVYVWGTYDGLWPEFDPGYPGAIPDHYLNRLRPCQAMIHGKYYLDLSSWPYNPNSKDDTYHLFHHHGDAFMTLYSEVPGELSISHDNVLSAGEVSFAISANYDAVIALTNDGEIIGVGIGEGTPIDIEISPQEAGDTVLVTITKANYYRYTSLVPVIDASPDVRWTKTLGGSSDDWGYAVEQTNDGGYIITGWTRSFGNGCDAYLIKVDSLGDFVWQNTFGGDNTEWGYDVHQTTDNGFVITGYTDSYGAGKDDVYLIKTNSLGDTVWTNTFGGEEDDVGRSVEEITGGGYIIAGYTRSFGVGACDALLIKTTASGAKLWQNTFGGELADWGHDVEQTTDGGYIITGKTNSFGAGSYDVYLVKTNQLGNMSWQKTFGGGQTDWGQSVQQTSDHGYIIVGATSSFGAGNYDIYLIKTNQSGNEIWTKTFGSAGSDCGYDVQQTEDGGYIITGSMYSYGTSSTDVALIKTDLSGNLLWQKTIGGAWGDVGYSIQQTEDYGFIIVGETCSYTPLLVKDAMLPLSIGCSVYLIRVESDPGSSGVQTVGEQNIDGKIPYTLQVFPSPFRRTTVINYTIPQITAKTEADPFTTLKIYDATGRLVRQFNHKTIRLSDYVVWDGTDDNGRVLPSGIYFVILENLHKNLSEKLILMK